MTDPSPRKEGAWEAICNRCGECCFEKWIDDFGRIHPTAIPCRYLDIVSRQCKVYHKRLEVGEGCIRLTPEVVERSRWLPGDCAYVKYVRNPCPGTRDPGPGTRDF